MDKAQEQHPQKAQADEKYVSQAPQPCANCAEAPKCKKYGQSAKYPSEEGFSDR